MNIAFVTDSTADLPEQFTLMFPIHVVPNLVVIDGKSLEDGKDISRREFYERIPEINPPPTTSTASIGVYQQLYENLLQQGAQSIISIHAPKLLSGIYNTANTAAHTFGDRVQVLDSEQLSLGLGFQVIAAAEAAARGASLDMILKIIDDVRKRVRVFAMLDTLEYVRRSGRVSWAKARLGNLLRIKSFIELRDGRVFNMGQARTRTKGINRLRKFLQELGPFDRLAILHTNAESDAQEFLETVKPKMVKDPLIVNVNTVIGTHVGPNSLGFAVVIQ
jgi:DegV family protein with EDD domain